MRNKFFSDEQDDDSRNLVRRRKPHADADMDITPMIDITFLLLIFFLVASRLDDSAAIELPPARHGEAVGTKNAVIITLGRTATDRADIFLGARKAAELLVATADLEQQVASVSDYVEREFKAKPKLEHVLLQAERGVKHREVARIAGAVGRATDAPLHVAVLETQ